MFHCSGDNQSRVNNTSLGVGGFVGSPVGEAAAGAAGAKGAASGRRPQKLRTTYEKLTETCEKLTTK